MNIYIVIKETGEYDSRYHEPIAWFFYEDQADDYAKKANQVFDELRKFYRQKARILDANAVLSGKNQYNTEYHNLIRKSNKFDADFNVWAVPQKQPIRYIPPKPEPPKEPEVDIMSLPPLSIQEAFKFIGKSLYPNKNE